MKLWMYGLFLLPDPHFISADGFQDRVLILVLHFAFSLFLTFVAGKARDSKWLYIAGILLFFVVGLSIWIACYEPYEGPFIHMTVFTGRITSMNTLEGGGGILRNWRLFSRPENIKYFDMGYVRLFYWYGIIPRRALCVSVRHADVAVL